MKTKKYILVMLLLSAAALAKSQNRGTDINGTALAQKLSLSPERGKVVRAAMDYRVAEITRLEKDKNIPPLQKQKQLKKLLAERKQHIDSVITPGERQQINALFAAARETTMAQIRQQETAAGRKMVKDTTNVKTH
jgi:hypothetical protein